MQNDMETMNEQVVEFFRWSDLFDHMVTRQLDHIRPNWELTWNHDEEKYDPEEDGYGQIINNLVVELSELNPPKKYHDNEDRLAEYCRFNLDWDIKKVRNRWVGCIAANYIFIKNQRNTKRTAR